MATTEGVVRPPSWFGITTGSPPCMTATTEFVVPKSIPMILLIACCLLQPLDRVDPGMSASNAAIINIECRIVKNIDCKYVVYLHLITTTTTPPTLPLGPRTLNLPIGVGKVANREIGVPRVSATVLLLVLSQLCGFRHSTIAKDDDQRRTI